MRAFAKQASNGWACVRGNFRQHRSAAAFLGAGALAAAWCGGQVLADAADDDANDLPVGKLACHRDVAAPRTPTVLVSCGSFNPPTVMHLRMFDLAVAALAEKGYDVWGCYMSPVADAYSKPDLAPVQHRLAMCRLAASDTSNVMVDAWEAAQPGYTRTLQVLRHVRERLTAALQSKTPREQSTADAAHTNGLAGTAAAKESGPSRSPSMPAASSSAVGAGRPAAGAGDPAQVAVASPRVMLLCGADLLASMDQPGVWQDPRAVLRDHGVVCICRAGTDMSQLLEQPGSLLHEFRANIIVVEEPVGNGVSSTKVRQLLAAGQPVRFLVPDAVIAYIKAQGLYGPRSAF